MFSSVALGALPPVAFAILSSISCGLFVRSTPEFCVAERNGAHQREGGELDFFIPTRAASRRPRSRMDMKRT